MANKVCVKHENNNYNIITSKISFLYSDVTLQYWLMLLNYSDCSFDENNVVEIIVHCWQNLVPFDILYDHVCILTKNVLCVYALWPSHLTRLFVHLRQSF